MKSNRLYVVSRADLSVGLAAAQCVHAAFLFARDQWEAAAPWLRDSQWVVLCTTVDEQALEELASAAGERRIPYTRWEEPDLSGQLTALALAPGKATHSLCGSLPLLGRELRLAEFGNMLEESMST